MDLLVRGHIVSYSLKAMELIFGRHGFTVGALPGKTFGFYVEYKPRAQVDFDTRIYQALPGNVDLLRRHELLYQGAFEAARSYLYYAGYLERTRWALALEAELDAIRSR
ncbi:MAG: hypothetical protein KIS72_01365 [Luteimonas sp.]|nr:hypothetical protein [Luteimonas sp.]